MSHFFVNRCNTLKDLDNLSPNYTKIKINFNEPIEIYPNWIKYIHFGHYFNQQVDNLPQTLKELYFSFNSLFSIISLSYNSL